MLQVGFIGQLERTCGNCHDFVNSSLSLSPVLLFRRRLSSVGDVLKGFGIMGSLLAGAYSSVVGGL